MLTITELACLRCGHSWLPRVPHPPKACPHCNSKIWDKPKEPQDVSNDLH